MRSRDSGPAHGAAASRRAGGLQMVMTRYGFAAVELEPLSALKMGRCTIETGLPRTSSARL